ncbi:MAG: fumarylacetoacetase [Acidobacteria bacterium]|nr:fumarylacetoacetase [Acidobacteriota bacterium]
MKPILDETHDLERESWVESANDPDADFPIQNLPLGLFSADEDEMPAIGVAIGNQILNLSELSELLWSENPDDPIADALSWESLEMVLLLDAEQRTDLRHRLNELLRVDFTGRVRDVAEGCLIPMEDVTMLTPHPIENYTDFYASLHHATNVGKLFRPDQPLLPNYKWMPIGYHGRASSIVIRGTNLWRPCGQTRAEGASAPTFGPTKVLDYELELGCFIGDPNPWGERINIEDAEKHIFGFCLLNDWSARDIQRWEYQPLGPFLAKSFATTISPWIVTLEALAPFRTAAFQRAADDPQPLPYLDAPNDRAFGGFNFTVEASLLTSQMRAQHLPPHRLCLSNAQELYWTFAQMLTHHTSNGCNLRSGDLIGSGTVSGATPDALGCLLELTQRGAHPIKLPTGEERRFLEDGDEIILRGWCEREGFRRIGFGECRGTILPAAQPSSS